MTVGYLVPVVVKACHDPSIGQGVFAAAEIAKGTLLWQPKLVRAVPNDEAVAMLGSLPPEKAHILLRQSFVTPTNPGALCINPTDTGRFTNHSATPNVGACMDDSADSYALRDIEAGEELTCDYSGFATPDWYKELCKKYGVMPTDEVVHLAANQQ